MTLVGKTIVAMRNMTDEEMEREGWFGREKPIVLELDDGTLVYPSQDSEGNGAGALFGTNTEGKTVAWF